MMISVKEAKQKAFEACEKLPTSLVAIEKSLGFVLAEEVKSTFPIPTFSQSAMDGFALCWNEETVQNTDKLEFDIIGEIKAGDNANAFLLSQQTAVKIYTGAPIPKHTTSVLMQEKSEVQGDKLWIKTEYLQTGSNIRLKGSQMEEGSCALKKGTVISPAAIGLLATLGIEKIDVINKPKIGLVSTGNELMPLGTALKEGQLYESNSYALRAAFQQNGFECVYYKTAKDEVDEVKNALATGLNQVDVLVVSGGISVGKYDLVKSSLEALGVEEILYKVAQKPGKPLYIGRLKNKIIAALPGNPAASLVCFYQYVLPILRKMAGRENYILHSRQLPLQTNYNQRGDRAMFLKAFIANNAVQILEGQGSDSLQSFAEANALVYLPAAEKELVAGTFVEVHELPNL